MLPYFEYLSSCQKFWAIINEGFNFYVKIIKLIKIKKNPRIP